MICRPTLTSVQSARLNVPARCSLDQNYPNPFNGSTIIAYSLPQQSRVVLKVFDLLGREVATLVSTVEQPGDKFVSFDASGLSTGIYLYRLEVGAFSETKKLLLIR
jgi:hypothetical protein